MSTNDPSKPAENLADQVAGVERQTSPEDYREELSYCLETLEVWLPVYAVSDPSYAATACEQLRRMVRKVESYLSSRAEADLPGQTSLPFESPPSSSPTSESPGETMPSVPE